MRSRSCFSVLWYPVTLWVWPNRGSGRCRRANRQPFVNWPSVLDRPSIAIVIPDLQYSQDTYRHLCIDPTGGENSNRDKSKMPVTKAPRRVQCCSCSHVWQERGSQGKLARMAHLDPRRRWVTYSSANRCPGLPAVGVCHLLLPINLYPPNHRYRLGFSI